MPAADIVRSKMKQPMSAKPTKTDENGRYFILLFRHGSYKLTVRLRIPNLHPDRHGLQVQQRANVDVVLKTGEVNTSVTVSGEAPRLDSVTATFGRVVESASVLEHAAQLQEYTRSGDADSRCVRHDRIYRDELCLEWHSQFAGGCLIDGTTVPFRNRMAA